QKVGSTHAPELSRRNPSRTKSALPPSIPAWWKRKVYAQPVSTKAIFAKALKRRHHSAASVNPMTLLRPRSFSLPPIPRGSQAKRYVSREAFVRPMKNQLQQQRHKGNQNHES